ncbi:hypothetical protein ACTJIJ_22455 [Niabella sp. 22666]|uniref:hypothetical protein n=1 Tax=Niabella sp. 22666 TaxID=3453954 RepID=UPI003F83A94C
MMRNYCILLAGLLVSYHVSVGQTVNASVIDAVPGNSFTHNGEPMPHYGLKWYTDAVGDGYNMPSAFLNAVSLKFLTGGTKRLSISYEGAMEAQGPFIINSTSSSTQLMNFKNNGSDFAKIGSASGIYGGSATDLGLYVYGNNNMEFTTNGAKRLVIAGDGKIGMGVTAPTEKLDINGNIRLNGKMYWGWDGRSIQMVSPDGGVSQVLQFTNSMSAGSGNPQGGFDFAWHNGESIMRIIGGNVGIGTTTPGEKLAVNGRILAKEIKIISGATTSWPDYVFNSNYKLTPLRELEQFIKTHQHLPEIPCVKEVAANGIEVGANQALLLKKVEELTLYIIEQNKEIKRLSEEVGMLKNNRTACYKLITPNTKIK